MKALNSKKGMYCSQGCENKACLKKCTTYLGYAIAMLCTAQAIKYHLSALL